ncbi:hypothetical protein LBMAG56_04590 [Verrucomicrobiota bacterium]|nr:hypothetical protein LBMAG56_04590 [Verrucomicrobiota bacterium]
MGIALNAAKMLLQAKRSGVRFDETLTLGRQYMLLGPERIEALLTEYGCWPPPEGAEAFRRALRETRWRFELFARALGAKNVSSCDASAYEQATFVHDLNQPVPADLEQRYDVVIDGGTLEHVFNFPVAMANSMKLVKPGGHLILFTPANNYFGHGFYQFSPELFYRVLAPENGFVVERMLGWEEGDGMSSLFGVNYSFPIEGPWYDVPDPAVVRQRVTLLNRTEVVLFVLARKVAHVPLFQKTPQQSDYVPQWQTGTTVDPFHQSGWGRRVIAWLLGHFSETFCREWMSRLALVADPFRLPLHRRRKSFKNRELYRRSDPGP